jgi:hypothetical protein
MSGGGAGGEPAVAQTVRELTEEELASVRSYRERYESQGEGARGPSEAPDGLSAPELAKITDAEIASLISADAFDLVVYYEVGGRAAYDKKYRRPEWPGAKSGVTIGIGYDIGQSSLEDFSKAWRGRLPVDQFDRLARTTGITGTGAAHLPAELRDIEIPWEMAEEVFKGITIGKYGRLVLHNLAHARELDPRCFGALFSLVYNRGASFTNAGDRYREMRGIRGHMHDRNLAAIPGDFRAMKRLWQGQGLEGLLKRRDAEADLFQRGLAAAVPAAAGPSSAAGVAASGRGETVTSPRRASPPQAVAEEARYRGAQSEPGRPRRSGRLLWTAVLLLAALAVIGIAAAIHGRY